MPIVVFWVWVVGGVLAIWPLSQVLARVMLIDTSERDEFAFAIGYAMVVALVWPAALLAVGAWRLSRWAWSRVLGEDVDETVRPARPMDAEGGA
jgi:hypothetical protein